MPHALSGKPVVAPDERIARMEEQGLLSPKQAALLRESLVTAQAPLPEAATGTNRRVAVWAIMLAAAGLVTAAVLGLAVFGGGGPGGVQDVTQTLNQPGEYGEMNRTLSVLIAAVLLLAVPLLLWAWLNNSLVGKEERVFAGWAQTESNFQRRADLIPALVETVSRYLKHESETITAVAEQRSAAGKRLETLTEELLQAQKESSDILREHGAQIIENEPALQRLFEAQAALGHGLTRLDAVAEAYPELRSADQFLQLQAQIEGTENRINVARIRFNEAVRDYNASLRMLPWNLVASIGNFRRKAYFRSAEEARNAPALGFR
jgi:LemA protein